MTTSADRILAPAISVLQIGDMKRHLSLSVSEFHQLLAALCAQAERELSSTRARMDALRTEELPPG